MPVSSLGTTHLEGIEGVVLAELILLPHPLRSGAAQHRMRLWMPNAASEWGPTVLDVLLHGAVMVTIFAETKGFFQAERLRSESLTRWLSVAISMRIRSLHTMHTA